MKNSLSIVMTVLFIAVFTVGKLPLYSCVKKGTFHIFSSCCTEKPAQEVTDSCCVSKKSDGPSGASLKEICCNNLDTHLDSPYTPVTEMKTAKVKLQVDYVNNLFTLNTRGNSKGKLSLVGNNSPPGEAFLKRPLTSPIFILYCSYLC